MPATICDKAVKLCMLARLCCLSKPNTHSRQDNTQHQAQAQRTSTRATRLSRDVAHGGASLLAVENYTQLAVVSPELRLMCIMGCVQELSVYPNKPQIPPVHVYLFCLQALSKRALQTMDHFKPVNVAILVRNRSLSLHLQVVKFQFLVLCLEARLEGQGTRQTWHTHAVHMHMLIASQTLVQTRAKQPKNASSCLPEPLVCCSLALAHSCGHLQDSSDLKTKHSILQPACTCKSISSGGLACMIGRLHERMHAKGRVLRVGEMSGRGSKS